PRAARRRCPPRPRPRREARRCSRTRGGTPRGARARSPVTRMPAHASAALLGPVGPQEDRVRLRDALGDDRGEPFDEEGAREIELVPLEVERLAIDEAARQRRASEARAALLGGGEAVLADEVEREIVERAGDAREAPDVGEAREAFAPAQRKLAHLDDRGPP